MVGLIFSRAWPSKGQQYEVDAWFDACNAHLQAAVLFLTLKGRYIKKMKKV